MAPETPDVSTEAGLGMRPPRDDLFRSLLPGVGLRSETETSRPVMFGHFAKFDDWYEVESAYEGHFLERVARGAFAKTIAENARSMQVLFHHGRDQLGMQVLGKIIGLEEDDEGPAYEVELFDGVPQLVMDGLRAGVYGSSHRFMVMREDYVQRPRKSDHNPKGLPERTIQEARVREFGPTPFPVYSGATSGVRSMTDDMLADRLLGRGQVGAPAIGAPVVSVSGSIDAEAVSRAIRSTLLAPERDNRSRREYRRSVEYVAETPWAMHPSALEVIHAIIGERASGHRPDADEIARRIGTRAESDATPPDSIALLRLSGPIVPKAGMMDETSAPLQSVEGFQGALRAALADGNVSAIVIDIDSPGGSVDLIPELASEILAGRDVKPIIGVANTMAASAAYWLGCSCSELVVTPSGSVGSIGVYSSHTDLSAAMAQKGIKTTVISAGDYKVERNPFEPLSREAEAEMQEKVDAYYEMFVAGVAAGRGVSTETVLSDFGQGRMLLAAKAVAVGMADRVATLDETLARLGIPSSDPAPEPPEATTPDLDVRAPEPSEATTRNPSRRATASYVSQEEKPSWQL